MIGLEREIFCLPQGATISTELAANLFRATQTEEKLRRDNIQTKQEANQTHFDVGKKVRQTIQELGGTMPEDLPTPDKSIKNIEKSSALIAHDKRWKNTPLLPLSPIFNKTITT